MALESVECVEEGAVDGVFVPEVLHRWQDWTLELIYPLEDVPATFNENEHSQVIALRKGEQIKYLWTGDLERRGEKYLLERNLLSTAEIWKAGHHGSHTSGTPAFLAKVRPRLVIISCGVDNRYNHPSHGPYVVAGDTVSLLRTDRDGSIVMRWDTAGRCRWKRRDNSWSGLP